MVERNMRNAVMRGIVVPPGSRATSRAKGSRRNLGYPASDHRLADQLPFDLIQRQVRLLDDERQQKFRMVLNGRSAATTWLCRDASSLLPALGPKHHHARAEFVSVGRLTTRRTGLDRFDYSGTQVVGIRALASMVNRINAARLAHRTPPICSGVFFTLPLLEEDEDCEGTPI